MPEDRPPPAPARPPASPAKSATRSQRAKVGVAGAFGWLGVFGIGAAVGAVLGALDVPGWVIGVVVSGLTVALGYLLRRELASSV